MTQYKSHKFELSIVLSITAKHEISNFNLRKQLNIQVHNAVPQDSPTTSSISTPSSSLNNNVAWEPADPFNELANRNTFQQERYEIFFRKFLRI